MKTITHYMIKNAGHLFEDEMTVIIDEDHDSIEFVFSDHYHGHECYYRSDKHVNKEKE